MSSNMIISKTNPPRYKLSQPILNRFHGKVVNRISGQITRRAALLATLLCAVGTANMAIPVRGALAAGNGAQTANAGPVEQPTLRTVSAAPLQKTRVAAPTNRVYNVTQNTSWADIQPAINAAVPGDVITTSADIFTGASNQLTIAVSNLTIIGAGTGSTIIAGINAGDGIYVLNGTSDVTITGVTVRNFTNGFRFGNVSNIYIANSEAVTNTTYGFFSNALSLSTITLSNVNASYNAGAGAPRGLMFQATNSVRQNIVITNSTFNYNGLVGVDFNIGSVQGLVFANNTLIGNGDSGLSAGYISGAQIWGNTLVNNGRFGIELKMPQGNPTLYPSSAGPVEVFNNNVSRTAPPNLLIEGRDLAGIAVIRRGVEVGMPQLPANVKIYSNTVSGYVQSGDHEGFGILAEGLAIQVYSNTLTGNEVGIQAQSTFTPSRNLLPPPGDNLTGSGASPAANDEYFDRGNAFQTCVFIANNIFSGSLITNSKNVGLIESIVTNLNTGNTYCAIQPAIDAASPGDVISAAAGVYTGTLNIVNIPLSKQPLTLTGVGTGSTIISGTSTGGVNGITLDDGTSGITLTKFTLRNFDNGIYGPDSGGSLSQILSEDIEVISNTQRGIFSQAFSTTDITFR